MPKVSVIMGVYNTGKKEILEKAINSILNQTFKDFEFIICDDGSTDDTLKLIQEICKNDNRVIIIRNEKNMGLAYTLNKCLEIAKGEYIARMDADDESMLNRFEKQVTVLDMHKEIGVINTNAYLFDEKGNWGKLEYNEFIKKEDFLYNNPIIHPAVMVRKTAYNLVNNYRDLPITLRVEDYDLFMRMFAKGVKMYTIQDILFRYRENKESKQRRKFRYRINEMKIRYYGFRQLRLFPKGIPYVIKPVIAGLIQYLNINKIGERK